MNIKGADPNTFEILNTLYSKDKNYVYFIDEELVDSDTKTFEIINNFYSKDKKNVYYLKYKLLNSDPSTFKVYDNSIKKEEIYYEAEDKNNYYQDGIIVKRKYNN